MTDKVRDHLANERTFLAWVRTSLGLIGLGFVLARMGLFLHEIVLAQQGRSPAPLPAGRPGHEFVIGGIVFLALGTALCGWAGWAYFRNRRAIDGDSYVPAGASVAALTALIVLGGLVVAWMALRRTVAFGG